MDEARKDVAYLILELEHKIVAYQKLHAEELAELRQALSQLTEVVLASADASRSAGDLSGVRKGSTKDAAVT